MTGLTFADGYFPFCIQEKDKYGNPFQEWDGSTFFPDPTQGPYVTGYSSGSASEYIPVTGDGTLYPIGFTLEELSELYWRVKFQPVETTASFGYPYAETVSTNFFLRVRSDEWVTSTVYLPQGDKFRLVCNPASALHGTIEGSGSIEEVSGSIYRTCPAPVESGFEAAVGNYTVSPTWDWDVYAGVSVSTSTVLLKDGLFYPSIGVGLGDAIPKTYREGIFSRRYKYFDYGLTYPYGTKPGGSASFWGKSFTLFLPDPLEMAGEVFGTASVTIDKNSAVYWDA